MWQWQKIQKLPWGRNGIEKKSTVDGPRTTVNIKNNYSEALWMKVQGAFFVRSMKQEEEVRRKLSFSFTFICFLKMIIRIFVELFSFKKIFINLFYFISGFNLDSNVIFMH